MPHDPPRPSPPAPVASRAAPTPSRLAGLAGLTGLSETLASLRVASGFLVAAVLICGLYFGRDILVPLALALLLAFLLDPAVTRLKRWRLPRVLAVAIVVLATLALLVVASAFVGKEVRDLGAELPTYQSTIRTKLSNLRQTMRGPGVLDGVMETLDTVEREVERMAPADATPRVQRVQIQEGAASPFRQALAWLDRAAGPLAEIGIALVFVVLVLLDRMDLRDRMLRLIGGNLHRATDAMDEAAARISRYLGMQLVVNLTYGVPMALGLWVIGVPGALLWGIVAAVLRFVPYVGPLISAVFPLTLAFAVDPGWSLLLWTLALILVLEVVSNNIIEPWLYGASTGLSALSLIVAATFWTALWGPVGLIMSTPLTVCLLVVGRYLPQLQFLDVLLGSRPALEAHTRMYQRLLAGEEEEAIALAEDLTADGASAVPGFYDTVAVPALRLAVGDHASVATAEHRLRLVTGMEALLDDIEEDHPGPTPAVPGLHRVLSVGGKWEVDALAARMLAHGMALRGVPAEHGKGIAASTEDLARLDLQGVELVCASWFSPQPQTSARQFCRRLRRRWPSVRIVLVLWNAPSEMVDGEAEAWRALGADALATSLVEAEATVRTLLADVAPQESAVAVVPARELERLQALKASSALDDGAFHAACVHTVQRAADIFDMPQAMLALVDEHTETLVALHGPEGDAGDGGDPSVPPSEPAPRATSLGGYVVGSGEPLVLPDVARDPRFAGHPALTRLGARAVVAVPLRDRKGLALGALCLVDDQPRTFSKRDVRLLQALADDLARGLSAARPRDGAAVVPRVGDDEPPSATVGQPVPA